MESIWYQDMNIPKMDSLSGSCHTEAVVIGGGLSGILTAYYLKQAGVDVMVIEGNRIGSGQTGKTTAKITVSHNLIYDRLIHERGWNQALQYAQANLEALNQYEILVKKLKIDCDFRICPSYLYAAEDSGCKDEQYGLNGPEKLFREAQAAARLGLAAELKSETELPFPVKAALCYERQACFHPLKFLSHMASELSCSREKTGKNRCFIVENTPVEQVIENQVITPFGTVTADHIVFASHFPFINRPGYYFMRMHQDRSYVAAFTGCQELQGMYLGIDPAPPAWKENASGKGRSFRSFGEYMLLGGYGHRTGRNANGGQYDKLKELGAFYWPGCKIQTCWSAQDCMTVSTTPYIGKYSSRKSNWYVAAGFQKWGMTSSMVSALLISRMIRNGTDDVPYAEVFSPQKLHLGEIVPKLMCEGMTAGKNLLKQNLWIPGKLLKQVLPGQGGVVWYQGKKLGVYRCGDGTLYFVTTRCPHLGCELTWNQEEKSWDCPCHGSRFDYRGNLLDNPAQKSGGNGIRISI